MLHISYRIKEHKFVCEYEAYIQNLAGNEPPRSKLRDIYTKEDDYLLRNLRVLKLFPLCGDPVASYRELQVKQQRRRLMPKSKKAKKKAKKAFSRKTVKKAVKKKAMKKNSFSAKKAATKKVFKTRATTLQMETTPSKSLMVEPGPPTRIIPSVEEPIETEEAIGTVTHYYSHLNVAVVQINKGTLTVGDTIRLKGRTTDFSQSVESMEYEHKHIDRAEPGQSVGIGIKDHAREHDIVYLVK